MHAIDSQEKYFSTAGSDSNYCDLDTGFTTIVDGHGIPHSVYISVTRDGSVWMRAGVDPQNTDWTHVRVRITDSFDKTAITVFLFDSSHNNIPNVLPCLHYSLPTNILFGIFFETTIPSLFPYTISSTMNSRQTSDKSNLTFLVKVAMHLASPHPDNFFRVIFNTVHMTEKCVITSNEIDIFTCFISRRQKRNFTPLCYRLKSSR